MSTGALGTLLSEQPYTFDGLRTIGKVVFLLDLVLFVTFSTLITTRFFLNKGALTKSLHDGKESFYFGTFWVSIGMLIYCLQAYAVPSCGQWLVTTLEVLYRLYAGCVLLVATFQYHVIFDLERLSVHEMMPAWILPLYPFLVLGPVAGTLLYSQPRSTSALPILIGGIAFQGLGWCFAFIQYTLYITRLTSGVVPDEAERPGMYVAVGPAAYTCSALIILGSQAQVILPPGFLGITTVPVGDICKAVGVGAGIFLWLVGFWFFALGTVGLIHGWKHAHFTLNWWAIIFPNAGLTIALIQIGNVLGSVGIKAVSSAMTVLLCGAWLWVASLNIRAVWRGQILWPHNDEDMEDVEGHEP
ncbi:voltage-dependent anion channel [Exophiala viscosa]|uniref:voltage-dependent anion channel n=1 Tax=Exophiala viscosa TaxID=2486360 RepID=UPI00219642EB|nr:voltage-dependent anion channel [Exophiala viscosa]